QLAGEYGRATSARSGVSRSFRRAARELLKLDDKDPKRLFEDRALIRRLVRIGVLDESRMPLDYVFALKIEDFLERRLQSKVFKSSLAKSIHHTRAYASATFGDVEIINGLSFVVRLDSQKHIDFGLTSPYLRSPRCTGPGGLSANGRRRRRRGARSKRGGRRPIDVGSQQYAYSPCAAGSGVYALLDIHASLCCTLLLALALALWSD
ncbi:hypothetical protein FB451DRAFT_1024060, partial [Mycena latifolia]